MESLLYQESIKLIHFVMRERFITAIHFIFSYSTAQDFIQVAS